MYVDSSGTNAVVVTVFGDGGLPIVGHTILFLEVDGVWYRAEFVSGMPHWENFFEFVIALFNMSPHIEAVTMDESADEYMAKYLSNYKSIVLEGDFSDILDTVLGWNEKDYGGYNLITNNCAQFVADMLSQSSAISEELRNYFKTRPVIPAIMDDMIRKLLGSR